MTRFVALLRALNVGGTGVIPMADLRGLFGKLGYGTVETLGASGNVLFSASGKASDHQREIEQALVARMGKVSPILLRTASQMRAVAAGAPFAEAGDTKRYVAFLDSPVGRSVPERMPGADVRFPAPREFEVYVVAAWTVARNVDPHRFLEKTLGTRATMRAWSVVQTLVDLAEGRRVTS